MAPLSRKPAPHVPWNLILRGRLCTGHGSWQHVRSDLASCGGPTAGRAGSAACGHRISLCRQFQVVQYLLKHLSLYAVLTF